jgi:hypothetical protein
MKARVTFLTFLFFFTIGVANAQLLNSSFEDWSNGDPVSWFTTDVVGFLEAVVQSSDAHDGSSSAFLEVLNLGGTGFIPVLISTDLNGNGHPVSEKHGSLKGWYKFSPLGNDWLVISVGMVADTLVIGAGGWSFQNTTSSWTEFTIPIVYTPGSPNPDQVIVSIGIYDSLGQVNPGSVALVDHFSLTDPSDVQQISGLPQDYSLSQNYPNPFNPITNIEYSIPAASFVELKVYDILGNEIATLVNQEQNAGVYRADFTAANLASGFYITQLKAGSHVRTIKMTLLK